MLSFNLALAKMARAKCVFSNSSAGLLFECDKDKQQDEHYNNEIKYTEALIELNKRRSVIVLDRITLESMIKTRCTRDDDLNDELDTEYFIDDEFMELVRLNDFMQLVTRGAKSTPGRGDTEPLVISSNKLDDAMEKYAVEFQSFISERTKRRLHSERIVTEVVYLRNLLDDLELGQEHL
jgi:hypothetical protein